MTARADFLESLRNYEPTWCNQRPEEERRKNALSWIELSCNYPVDLQPLNDDLHRRLALAAVRTMTALTDTIANEFANCSPKHRESVVDEVADIIKYGIQEPDIVCSFKADEEDVDNDE